MMALWTIKNGITTPDFPFFYPTEEVQAVGWLAENTDEDDLILAYYPMGNYLPREINGRTFIGHLNLTIDLDNKLAEVEKFWNAKTSMEWREAFLRKWGIDYIYMGSFEMGISGEAVDVPGVIVYEGDGVKIFKFSP
jgi:hypothetical protein